MKNKKEELKKMSKDFGPGDYCEVFNKKFESKGFYFFFYSDNGIKYFVKDAREAVRATSPIFGKLKSKIVFKYAKIIKKLELNIKNTDEYVEINGIKYNQFNEVAKENREMSALLLYFNSFEYDRYVL